MSDADLLRRRQRDRWVQKQLDAQNKRRGSWTKPTGSLRAL